MAAYAALVSLMHIIHQIEHHPRPPISLDKQQVESLTEKVNFLQEFLEGYSHVVGYNNEGDALESRIAGAVYAAEDVIERHIVDQILAGSTSDHGEEISCTDLYQGLQNVIEDIDSIKMEVLEIKEKMAVQDQLHRNSSVSAGSLRTNCTEHSTMVGFDDVLYEMMDKLTRGKPDRQIIPIVGMGGIGKTTLARNIYENQLIVQHFDILAWVTISQQYRMREILSELLLCVKTMKSREILSKMSEDELGEMIYRTLSGRRYLIIIDDIWDIEVWDKLKFYFPDDKNGSRIVLTSRLFELAIDVTGCLGIKMRFLDEDTSWNLLCKIIFGEEDCPLELEEIGKHIAKNCKGLPLSIVVIGGLLAKSEKTIHYWQNISENLNSNLSLEGDEHCLKVLYMSYNNLPVHLKPCFLYMGFFPEDYEIDVFELIMFWVVEGFLKPIVGQSLEEVGEQYLYELILRNLVLIRGCNSYWKIKSCMIHDLLRDLCLREVQKQKFFCILKNQSLNIPQNIDTERRICISNSRPWDDYLPQVVHELESAARSASLVRSLTWEFQPYLPSFNFRLLRVSAASVYQNYNGEEVERLEDTFKQVNLRCIEVKTSGLPYFKLPSSISRLWNLQTLIVGDTSQSVIAPPEIWKMPLLRHIMFFSLQLPDPPTDRQDDIVLENLQTLLCIKNFKCDEEVVKRIPNIKKLKVSYAKEFEEVSPNYFINNLGQLHKLESFYCCCEPIEIPRRSLQNLTLPHSLKKLTLYGTCLHWEDMTTKIGSLPLLQVLKLKWRSFTGPHWETVEGQFNSLIFLQIEHCYDLKYWTTDNYTHFPCLEDLVLVGLYKLAEIPPSVGDIPTLQSIRLLDCSHSTLDSAKRIQEEQEELGNAGLKVHLPFFALENEDEVKNEDEDKERSFCRPSRVDEDKGW